MKDPSRGPVLRKGEEGGDTVGERPGTLRGKELKGMRDSGRRMVSGWIWRRYSDGAGVGMDSGAKS